MIREAASGQAEKVSYQERLPPQSGGFRRSKPFFFLLNDVPKSKAFRHFGSPFWWYIFMVCGFQRGFKDFKVAFG